MSSAQDQTKSSRLISQLLLEDADLRDIVEEFVAELDGRLQELRDAHDKMDWDLLVTLAHRLKGAAGSYGYPDISQVCAALEQQIRAQETDGFNQQIGMLDELIGAAKAGLGGDQA